MGRTGQRTSGRAGGAPVDADAGQTHGGRPAAVESAPAGVVVGSLAGLDPEGQALVDYPGNTLGILLAARSVVPLGPAEVGRQVVLQFEGGDPWKPVVMGLIQTGKAAERGPAGVSVDGDRLILSADKEIVLRCGEASVTLTRAGKVLIRGKYLLSRSTGVNQIKGGSVQIN